MRQKIVAGNWKMFKTHTETIALLTELKQKIHTTKAQILVAPPFVNLHIAKETLKGTAIEVAAQNMHQAEGGAFTGEISANMLTDIGLTYVILGHSERRAYFHETDAQLANKVDTALKHNLKVIFCFGEELKDRQNNNHFTIVENQLKDALFHLEASAWEHIILAYEPVWAIGTGETASPDQAQEMHHFIRNLIHEKYDAVADDVRILYGGSVKPDNAKEIFSKPDVDGGLIGGASLKADDFLQIIAGAE